MIKYQSSTDIMKSPDEVFKFVSDPATYPQWTDVVEGRYLTQDPVGKGSKAENILQMGSKKIRVLYEVTDWDPGRIFGFKTTPDSDVFWQGSYSLESIAPGSTRVTNSGELQLKGIMRLLEPFMSGEVKRGEAAELEKLKKLIEA